MLNPSPSPKALMLPAESSFYAQLGRRIAERRKPLGITQVQLAEALGRKTKGSGLSLIGFTPVLGRCG